MKNERFIIKFDRQAFDLYYNNVEKKWIVCFRKKDIELLEKAIARSKVLQDGRTFPSEEKELK